MLTSGAHSIIYRLITQGCGKNTETPAKSAAYITSGPHPTIHRLITQRRAKIQNH